MQKLLRYLGIMISFGMILFMFMVIADAVSTMPTGYVISPEHDNSGSCENSCGGKSVSEKGSCHCDEACTANGDCCGDYQYYCA